MALIAYLGITLPEVYISTTALISPMTAAYIAVGVGTAALTGYMVYITYTFISGLLNEINGLKSEINTLKQEIKKIEDQTPEMEVDGNGLEEEVAELRAEVHTVIKLAPQVAAQVAAANNISAALTEQKGLILSVQTESQTEQKRLNDNIATSKKRLEDGLDEVATLRDTVNTLGASIRDYELKQKQGFEEIKEEIKARDNAIEDNKNDFEDAKASFANTVNNYNGQIININQRIEALARALNELEARIKKQATIYQYKMNQTLETMQNVICDHEETLNKNAATLHDHGQTLSKHAVILNHAAKRLKEDYEDLRDHEEDMAYLDDKILNLSVQVEELAKSLNIPFIPISPTPYPSPSHTLEKGSLPNLSAANQDSRSPARSRNSYTPRSPRTPYAEKMQKSQHLNVETERSPAAANESNVKWLMENRTVEQLLGDPFAGADKPYSPGLPGVKLSPGGTTLDFSDCASGPNSPAGQMDASKTASSPTEPSTPDQEQPSPEKKRRSSQINLANIKVRVLFNDDVDLTQKHSFAESISNAGKNSRSDVQHNDIAITN